MTTEAPVLSVIAPCFNEELNVDNLVARTLASLDALPVPAELILVDDGSRDATWARIEALEKAHDRVRGFRHAKNKGIVGGWPWGSGCLPSDGVRWNGGRCRRGSWLCVRLLF